LLVSAGAVIFYSALMVNFVWFIDENVYCISTKQHGCIKLGVSWSKDSTISQAACAGALSCCKVWKWSFWTFFLWLQW